MESSGCCILFVFMNCVIYAAVAQMNSTTSEIYELDCIDRMGQRVVSGEKFEPDEDPCKSCYCVDGYPELCTLVQCSPPSCSRWEPILDQCCKFRCLDWLHFGDGSTSSQNDFDGPSFHLRLALSGTTSLLIVALLIFMVHRLRQRRLLILMRRISEEQRCIGQDETPYTAEDLSGFDFSAFKEPPPPYSSRNQILDRHYDPPPYDSTTGVSTASTDVVSAGGGNCNEAVSLSPAVSEGTENVNVVSTNSTAGFSSNV